MSKAYYADRIGSLKVELFREEWSNQFPEKIDSLKKEIAGVRRALLSMKYTPRKEVRISTNDPDNSVSLFDTNRKNEFGEDYCVAPDILDIQVEVFWQTYVDEIEREFKENN